MMCTPVGRASGKVSQMSVGRAGRWVGGTIVLAGGACGCPVLLPNTPQVEEGVCSRPRGHSNQRCGHGWTRGRVLLAPPPCLKLLQPCLS